ncbi:MAG: hypothetical protein JWL81_3165 [Verrucomicrobiales bacterium]|nr:hypothetical protein [Verrucomicrobiales bacterium]
MRTIIHLSDLHFGRTDPDIPKPLLECIRAAEPDLVAISGDLTQRAHVTEFLEARAFLDAIPFPLLVVPGNHDVPLYNLYGRFVQRLRRYRRYITPDLAPLHEDEEISVAGINTARSLTIKDGRINRGQITSLKQRFCDRAHGAVKIVVTHHPFDLPPGLDEGRIVGGARRAMEVLAHCRVDLLLAGHFHIGHTGSSTTRFKIPGYSALLVSSGTSTSTRGRGQANSFNVIRTTGDTINIVRWEWIPEQKTFLPMTDETFRRTTDGWSAAIRE